MFDTLSNLTLLADTLRKYPDKQANLAIKNMNTIIETLNASALDLLSNRRKFGVIIGENQLDKLPTKLTELLLAEHFLIGAINQLCLTEAIIVRDTFVECLEELAHEKTTNLDDKNTTARTIATALDNTATMNCAKKSKVSPIRLNEIKQRLSQAIEPSTHKQTEIKNKLNALLPTKKAASITLTKQA